MNGDDDDSDHGGDGDGKHCSHQKVWDCMWLCVLPCVPVGTVDMEMFPRRGERLVLGCWPRLSGSSLLSDVRYDFGKSLLYFVGVGCFVVGGMQYFFHNVLDLGHG